VEVVGDTDTLAPFKFPGFQVYVDAPAAFSVMELPIQIEAVTGVMLIFGTGLTTNERVEVLRQPIISTPVTE
jgi:hypothetical protein